jgi:hypothetical protein
MKKYLTLIVIIITTIVVANYMVMNKTEININDSFKNRPEIEAPKESNQTTFELNLADHLAIRVLIMYDTNSKEIRVSEIKAFDIEQSFASKKSVYIGTNYSLQNGEQAIRITINLSYSSLIKNEVGSSVIKLTQKGDLIQYSKTDNVSEFRIIQNK